MIKGYSKSTEYLPGEEFVDTRYRNTWNAVFAAGGWRLIQCNWAMLNLHSKVASSELYRILLKWRGIYFKMLYSISSNF